MLTQPGTALAERRQALTTDMVREHARRLDAYNQQIEEAKAERDNAIASFVETLEWMGIEHHVLPDHELERSSRPTVEVGSIVHLHHLIHESRDDSSYFGHSVKACDDDSICWNKRPLGIYKPVRGGHKGDRHTIANMGHALVAARNDDFFVVVPMGGLT